MRKIIDFTKKAVLKVRNIFHNATPNHHLETKIGIFFLCLAILFLLVGLLMMNGKLTKNLNTKTTQIDALIDEMGKLQDENYEMYLNLKVSEIDLKRIMNVLDSQTGLSGDIKQKEDQLTTLKKEITKVKNDLSSISDEKLTALSENVLNDDKDIKDILILGKHGNLTDTIIIATINFKSKKITLNSIPRDLYVMGRKINEVYDRYGVSKLAAVLYDVTGVLLDKYMEVDMQAFVEIVDTFEGFSIKVDKAIYDGHYPNDKGGYEIFSLEAGAQHFDGATALKYARSRKSTSDFDRSKRQYKILEALLAKIKKQNFLQNLDKAEEIYSIIVKNVSTDISLFDALEILKDSDTYNLQKGDVLSTANYLYSTANPQGQYILLPKKGDYTEVREYFQKARE